MREFQESISGVISDLNEDQIKALVKSYTCNDYQMIVGVPGSGKHEVVARFLLLARKMKKKVLVMGISNQSIDNILHRLIALQDKFKDYFEED